MQEEVYGRIHSVESFGALDGPGVRYVLFLQGCPLRCLYCHNPDTWKGGEGKLISSTEVVKNIIRYRSFIINGGVTLSGGEPLLQAKFCQKILEGCRQHGLHTAIDTSGAVPLDKCVGAVNAADLILLDIKALDNELCKKITGRDNSDTLNLLQYCQDIHKAVWIRHVLVPGLTLYEDKLVELADYLKLFDCIQKVELLPFHKMGEYKWEKLGCNYTLHDTRVPDENEINMAREIFKSRGFNL